jgi:hypothetical protein
MFFFYLLLNSASFFVFNAQDVESYLDEMLNYLHDFKKQENKLSDVIKELVEQLESDEDNPYLWYLKGRSSWAALCVFDNADARYEGFEKLIPVEYEKVLALNKKYQILTEDQLYHIHGSHSV